MSSHTRPKDESTGLLSAMILFRLVVENRSVMWYRTAFRAEAENGLVA
jgi:hypothetical protein